MRNSKSSIGARNKRKGNKFELDIIKKLNDIGYECVSSRAKDKMSDANKVDIIELNDKLPCDIQCKYTLNTPNYFDIKAGHKGDKPFTIVWKKTGSEGHNSPGTIVLLDLDFFLQLIKR